MTKALELAELAQTLNVDANGNIDFNEDMEVDSLSTGYASFNLAAAHVAAPGELAWNSEEGTLDLGLDGEVTLQVGQEQLAFVRNLSGTTITNGTVVRVTGASGNKITIDLASNVSEGDSSSTFAVSTQVIGNNSSGYVTFTGLVRDLNTSAFTEGAPIWLGVSGQFTQTEPVSPNHLVHVGWVVRSHATEGSIYVKINNGWELEELHNVNITSVATNNMLRWNGTVWVNDVSTTDFDEAGAALALAIALG